MERIDGVVNMEADIIDFIHHENQLLDERKYSEWVSLFAEDGVYWLPGTDNTDPSAAVNLIYDSRGRLEERLLRMNGRMFWAQQPPSLMTRLIGNVRLERKGDEPIVRAKLVLVELRHGRQRLLSGTVHYSLRRVASAEMFLIVCKKVELIQADQPFDNLTYLV